MHRWRSKNAFWILGHSLLRSPPFFLTFLFPDPLETSKLSIMSLLSLYARCCVKSLSFSLTWRDWHSSPFSEGKLIHRKFKQIMRAYLIIEEMAGLWSQQVFLFWPSILLYFFFKLNLLTYFTSWPRFPIPSLLSISPPHLSLGLTPIYSSFVSIQKGASLPWLSTKHDISSFSKSRLCTGLLVC